MELGKEERVNSGEFCEDEGGRRVVANIDGGGGGECNISTILYSH